MDSTDGSSYIWVVLLACGIILYAGYWLYKKRRGTESGSIGSRQILTQTKDSNSLSSLRSECRRTYIELEKIRSLKGKSAKIVAGDISILTAMRQLESIFSSGRDDAYMAPRIIGQVCDFLINMAAANKMIDSEGHFVMPKVSPHLLDEKSYFENLQALPVEQAAKYEAVINYQSKELSHEQSNLRFVKMLQELLPPLQTATYLTENEEKLSAEEIVAKAENMYKEISTIFDKYGYKE